VGLRISEVCKLRVEDIDRQRMVIAVKAGKGNRDRHTMLPRRLLEVLRSYWKKRVRRDRPLDLAGVALTRLDPYHGALRPGQPEADLANEESGGSVE
jgi:integrase